VDWIVQVGDSCVETLVLLVPVGLALAVLARLMPCNRGMHWWNDLRAAGTDLLYWFVLPLVVRVCRTLMLWGGIALAFGGGTPGFESIRAWPIWVQCIAVLLMQDVLLYWVHRGFHTRLAWRFHAVHHSPKVLDWLSAARFHLVNHLFSFVLADVVALLMGFSPLALVTLVPFNMVYSAMVHANLNWTFGPLRFVLASPVFHRWHHVAEGEGVDKNFASTFPILDLLFGTFYMPAGELPEHFGNGDRDFPEDFWGQLVYPFLKKSTQPELAETEPLRKAA
jgi:sterol desaturase/sphingolipid hydroxylase (fatty acid hydroxylase superfamily)